MNKDDIYQLMNDNNIIYTLVEHEAVYTIEEMLQQNLPEVDAIAKNLFLRDDKNRDFYLVTAHEDARVNMKELQQQINSRRLTFAKSEQLDEILGLYAGAVSPLGLLNDKEKRVHFIYDDTYTNQRIGIHPLDNKRTIYAEFNDILDIIRPFCKEIIPVHFEKTTEE